MSTQAMKLRTLYQGVLIVLSAGVPCSLADDGHTTPALEHNPFLRPAFIDEPASLQSGNVAHENMVIRGVLISQKGTLVNINGSILALHDIINGYELVALDGEKAVLSKDGQEIVLDFPNTSGDTLLNRSLNSRSNQ